MSQFHGTPMERRQQAADANWAALERREMAEGFAVRPLAVTTNEPPKSEPKEKLP